ncbi:MAG: SHOCT domain-containing protein [Deltaproteobacteria bacterium]|nr:SHOCT domain-containing protein [Deltaproteobacteria bacterium]
MAERPDSKPCSACGEPILRLASRCKHCGARVRDADAPGSALQVAAGLSGRVVAGAAEAGSAPVAPGSPAAPAARDASAPAPREASAPVSTGADRWAPPGAYIPPSEAPRAAPVTLGADTVSSPPPVFSAITSSAPAAPAPPAAMAASAPAAGGAAPAAPLSFGASTQLAPGGPPPPAQEPRAPVAFSFTRPGAAEPTPEAPTTDGGGLDELDHRRRRLFSPPASSAAPSLPPAPRGGRPRALDEEAPTGLVLNPEAAPPAGEPEPEPAGRGAYFDPRVAPLAPRAPAPQTPPPPAPEAPRPETAAAPAPPPAAAAAEPEPDAPELAPGLLGWTAASAADDHIPRVVSIATGLIGLMLFLTPWAYGPEEGVVMPMALFSEGLSAQVLLPLVASLALLVSGFLPSLTAAGRGVLLLVAGLAGTLSLSLAAPEFFPGDIELSAPVALGVCCLLAATVARATRSNSAVARTLAVIGIIFIGFAYLLPREIAGKRGQPLELIASGMTGGTARTLAHAWALLPALLAVSVAVVFRGPERERDSAGRIAAWLAVVLATYVPLAFVFGGAAVVGGDRAMATLAWKLGLLGVCYSVWLAVGAMPVLDSWWRSSNEQRKRAAIARAAALAQQATMAAQGPLPLGYQGAPYQPHYPAPGTPFSPQPVQYPPPAPYQQHAPPAPYQQHAPGPPPPAATPPPPAASDVASRLQVLAELRDRGLITAAEYEDRRRTILERI